MAELRKIITGKPYPTCPSCDSTFLDIWNDGRVLCLNCDARWVDEEWLYPGMEPGTWIVEHDITFAKDDRTALARCKCGWEHDEGGALAGRRVAEAAHQHLVDNRVDEPTVPL